MRAVAEKEAVEVALDPEGHLATEAGAEMFHVCPQR